MSALIVAAVHNDLDFTNLLIILGVIAPLAGILHWLESWIAHDMAFRLLAELRINLFNKLDELDLQPGSIDILLGLGAVHHVENLEGLWATARQLLRPGGVVMAQEYIGPNRFQWTDAQMAVGTEVLSRMVPDEHEPHHDQVIRIPPEEIAAVDPSEAVRRDHEPLPAGGQLQQARNLHRSKYCRRE